MTQSFSTLLRLSAVALTLALAACGAPNSSFYNRGHPESLLDVSSEVVNLSVGSKADLDALSDWIAKDAPTRAELFCDANQKNCQKAVAILENRDVAVSVTPSPNNNVTLVYERIVARDCNQRYLDTGFSLNNTYPPSFGCSVSANMVQQVSDKREFVSPNISDDPSAVGAVSAYRRGTTPGKVVPAPYGVNSSTTNSASSGGGS